MLGVLIARNTADAHYAATDVLYSDAASHTTLLSSSENPEYTFRQIRFGSDTNTATETLGGGSLADRLYGMGGNDILNGGGGNDTLIGGRGDDTLKGGADNDTYIYLKGDGKDTLTDLQGHNKIYIGDTLLTGTTGGPTAVDLTKDTATWNVNDGEYIYVRDKKNNTLTITGSALGDAADNSITINLDATHNDTQSIHDLFGLNLTYLGLQAGVDTTGNILSDLFASVATGVTQVLTIFGTGQVQLACDGYLNPAMVDLFERINCEAANDARYETERKVA